MFCADATRSSYARSVFLSGYNYAILDYIYEYYNNIVRTDNVVHNTKHYTP